ncbi:unnamed protein product [Symbiodinium microadriaticum]|nr:unnamed protein product [Symbiodinium microadriaticum]
MTSLWPKFGQQEVLHLFRLPAEWHRDFVSPFSLHLFWSALGRSMPEHPIEAMSGLVVHNISEFRDRTAALGQQWQIAATTPKPFRLEVAERFGLNENAGDWDPGETYKMDVAKFEEVIWQRVLARRRGPVADRVTSSKSPSPKPQSPSRQASLKEAEAFGKQQEDRPPPTQRTKKTQMIKEVQVGPPEDLLEENEDHEA